MTEANENPLEQIPGQDVPTREVQTQEVHNPSPSPSSQVSGVAVQEVEPPTPLSWSAILFRCVAILIVLSVSGAVSYHWTTNQPRAKRRKPPKSVPAVKIMVVEKKSHPIVVPAMGNVMPAEKVELEARVSGPIIEVNPKLVRGGILKKGETVAKIDPSDYKVVVNEMEAALDQAKHTRDDRELAIKQADSIIATAKKNLKLELGQQEIARREYKLLTNQKGGGTKGLISPEKVSKEEQELILRLPQLEVARAELATAVAGKKRAQVAFENAKAAVRKAKTALKKAKLDLERTTIKSPFNAIVQSKNIGVGSNVSSGTSLTTIINTETYWVEASIPVSKLKWVKIPRPGQKASQVKVYYRAAWGKGRYRMAQVLNLDPNLEAEGRMAKVILNMEDPLSLEEKNKAQPRVILSSYVEVHILGKKLQSAVKIPRTALRDKGQVWLLTKDNTLAFRDVVIGAKTPEHLFITKGLEAGDQVITGEVPTPVEGMEIQKAKDVKNKKKGDKKGNTEDKSIDRTVQ